MIIFIGFSVLFYSLRGLSSWLIKIIFKKGLIENEHNKNK